MNFCFLNGVKIPVKGKPDESFLDVFKRFHENQCPGGLENCLCEALHNSLPIDNKISLLENKIKDGDNISFIIQDENYDKYRNEDGEKEEEDDDSDSEDDDEEEKKSN